MQNIVLDDGYKEFSINNDLNRVIRFNPADYGLLERFNKARNIMQEEVNKILDDVNLKSNGEASDELEEAANIISNVNKVINEQIDYIFDSEVSHIVFGNQSPISTVNGKFLFERFLDAVSPLMEKEIKAEQAASQKRIGKYTKQVK